MQKIYSKRNKGLSQSGKQENKWTTSFGHIGKTPEKSMPKASVRAKVLLLKLLGKLIDHLK